MSRRPSAYRSPGYRCKDCDTPLHATNVGDDDGVCELCNREKALALIEADQLARGLAILEASAKL